MIGGLILGVLVLMSAVMAVGWIVQRRAGDSGWVDVFWTFGTGAVGVGCAVWTGPDMASFRQWLVAALVAIWSVRLGTFIALRVLKGPEDARYKRLRKAWGAAYQSRLFWFMQAQAPCTALLCLSIALAAHHPATDLRGADIAGLAILIIAIAGESLADAQLNGFRADPANHGKINDRGLWAWSRHPNYFFEWFGWLAYPVIAFDPANLWSLLSLAGPVFMYVILTRFTGVPYLEEHMAQSRGDAWRDYARQTPAFFPKPPRSAPK